MPWVYIVLCCDNSFYTGSTFDLDLRLWQHNFGEHGVGANYTFKRRPVELVFAQFYESIEDAFALEKRIHGWSHAKKLALIEGRFEDLPNLSRNRTQFPVGGPSPGSGTVSCALRRVQGP